MKRKLFIGSAIISTTFFLTFVGLFIYAWTVKPNLYFESHHYFPIFGGIKMTVTDRWGGNILFFDQEAPYTDSIVSLTGDKTSVKGCDGWGIYFRLIINPDRKDSWWTLMFSLWYPIVIFCVLPLISLIQKWRTHQKTYGSNLA
jgi:hypothetical protein